MKNDLIHTIHNHRAIIAICALCHRSARVASFLLSVRAFLGLARKMGCLQYPDDDASARPACEDVGRCARIHERLRSISPLAGYGSRADCKLGYQSPYPLNIESLLQAHPMFARVACVPPGLAECIEEGITLPPEDVVAWGAANGKVRSHFPSTHFRVDSATVFRKSTGSHFESIVRSIVISPLSLRRSVG